MFCYGVRQMCAKKERPGITPRLHLVSDNHIPSLHSIPLDQLVQIPYVPQRHVRYTIGCVQLGNKGFPPFFKLFVRPSYLQPPPCRLCLCLCGFSMGREGKAKVSIEALNGSHSVQAQQTGGKVYTVPGRITRPASPVKGQLIFRAGSQKAQACETRQ